MIKLVDEERLEGFINNIAMVTKKKDQDKKNKRSNAEHEKESEEKCSFCDKGVHSEDNC